MIEIYKNTGNTIVFTASELISYSGNTYFSFLLENCQSHKTLAFAGVNISTNTERYDEFLLVETGKTYQNLTASTVNLDEGEYLYKVYAHSGNTILNNSNNLVEQGLMNVLQNPNYTGTTSYSNFLNSTGQTKNFLGNI